MSATRAFATGRRSSAGNIPIAFVGAHRRAATNGIWTRSSSRPRQEALAMARRRSAGLRSRRSRPKQARSNRRTAAHAQASQEVGQSAPRHDHRQAQIVWRCAQGHGLADRASPAQGAKQSGGKFPSADKTTGADYEAVQIAATGPEIPVHSRSSRQSSTFPATNSQPSIIAPLALRPSRPGQRLPPHGLPHDAA
jgi:hypothetical protein